MSFQASLSQDGSLQVSELGGQAFFEVLDELRRDFVGVDSDGWEDDVGKLHGQLL